jgi:hypothetical protein
LRATPTSHVTLPSRITPTSAYHGQAGVVSVGAILLPGPAEPSTGRPGAGRTGGEATLRRRRRGTRRPLVGGEPRRDRAASESVLGWPGLIVSTLLTSHSAGTPVRAGASQARYESAVQERFVSVASFLNLFPLLHFSHVQPPLVFNCPGESDFAAIQEQSPALGSLQLVVQRLPEHWTREDQWRAAQGHRFQALLTRRRRPYGRGGGPGG